MNNDKSGSHEIWKDIEGCEGRYQVSSCGRIRNAQTLQIRKTQKKHGYVRINLTDNNGNDRNCSVHRLVASVFVPNPENKPHVNHIDGVKDNNRAENLEWVTPEENFQHAIDNHLYEKGIERAKRLGGSGFNRKDKPKALLRKSEWIDEPGYERLVSKVEELGCSIASMPTYYEDKIHRIAAENTSLIKTLIKEISDRENAIRKIVYVPRREDEWRSELHPIGEKSHHLTIVGYWRDNKTANKYYICQCDCGNHHIVHTGRWGKTKSCGCVQAEAMDNQKRHDWLYTVWRRCYRKPEWYDDWKNYDVFYDWAYSSGYEFGKHLHRKDVNDGFNPDNCIWKDKQQQVHKPHADKVKRYSVNGEMLSIPEAEEKYNISAQLIRYRMKHRGMTVEEAVNTPKDANGRKKKNSLSA